MLSSSKIVNFVQWVEIDSYFINKKVFFREDPFLPKKDFLVDKIKSKGFPSSFDVKVLQKWYAYICGGVYTEKLEKIFLHTINCKYMPLNVVYVFLCSVLNPVLFWNCSSNMDAQIRFPQKWFFTIFIQFKLRQPFQVSFLKPVLESHDVCNRSPV